MARANLIVGEDLRRVFHAANEGQEKIRWIKARVDDVTMKCLGKGASKAKGEEEEASPGGLEKDLKEIRDKVLDTDACFILFCMNPSETAQESRRWVLIAHVPSTCLVKRRMLYASGRDDLKTSLGASCFIGEVHCTDVEDLTVDAVMRPSERNAQTADLPWTDQELLEKEEHAASARPAADKSEKGMASIQFRCTAKLLAAAKQMSEGKVDWIECRVTDTEEIELVKAELLTPNTSSSSPETGNGERLHKNEPRFYLVRRKAKDESIGQMRYLIFHCPESAAIRQRMVYSTCKATLLEQINAQGVEIDKLLETREGSELDDQFRNNETVDQNAGKIVHQSIDRPKGPPRRKR